MPSLIDLGLSGTPAPCRPWPRCVIDADGWNFAVDEIAAGRWTMSGLWAEPAFVHMALIDEARASLAIFSMDCRSGSYPAVSRRHAPAARLERAIRDVWGLNAAGAADVRPWLDHGCWENRGAPPAGVARTPSRQNYAFLPVDGEALHQIPVGPVHAGVIEPGHFRFTASGETVARLEARLGYVHKGVEALMRGADLDAALKIAGRISGDSTAAYALAFSRAVEAAADVEAPPRAAWLRGLILELERIANHLGDIGAVCNDAAFTLIHAHASVLREQTLRAADSCFGHRLMRDVIAPGGVVRNLSTDDIRTILSCVDAIERRLPALIEEYEETSSLQDRTVGTGRLKAALARQFGAGGFVGRASGRAFDARVKFAFPPYDALNFEPSVLEAGDVDARVRIRMAELRQSLSLIRRIVDQSPAGPVFADPLAGAASGEGVSIVEGFRGDILVWLRLSEDRRIDHCHLRDPSWFQWPLLEAAIEGNIVADFPLCNKSFNCSYSGHDL